MAESSENTNSMAAIWRAKRLVIKVGSALLLTEGGDLARDWLEKLARDIAQLRAAGIDVAIVSSGSIGFGRRRLGLSGRLKLEEKQAAAAAGQGALMEAWQAALAPHQLTAAQILLTLADAEHRRRYLNACATINTLLELGAVPVINENDTTATDEIRYGDNDRLAAHVAQMCGADHLLILSDIDGMYDKDPRAHQDARHLPVIETIDAKLEAAAGGPNKARGAGSGGMRTKIEAAKIALAAGCATTIAKGDIPHPVSALKDGARSTLFPARQSADSARRAWISGRLAPTGEVHIDAGALKALRDGASLLPAGVTALKGDFTKGDAVSVIGPDGRAVAQGLSAYHSDEIALIKGLKSQAVEEALGYRRTALIHRNDLVVFAP